MKVIKGDVNLNYLHLREIPEILKDVSIEGALGLSNNNLRSLKNCPRKIAGLFSCTNNRGLQSLIGGPEQVGAIDVHNCNLTSLQINAPYKDIATYSVSLQGSGAYGTTGTTINPSGVL